ncbi:ammonium transporter [Methyloparacoccus murrellii]
MSRFPFPSRLSPYLPPKAPLGHIALTALFAANPALADDARLDSGDTAWMLTSTALVLLMTIPGLALFYGGMVRKKNVLSVLMQCFAICCLMTVLWFLFGYSLALTPNGNEALNQVIGSLDKVFLLGVTATSLSGTIPEWLFIMFQMTFAIITPALIVGAFAERMKFSALLWFSGLWLILIYIPVAHSVWGGGFLGSAGVLDFAGGTVVHINAGIAGLVAALIVGKRKGYGTVSMAPHNLTLSMIGASLLWVGWFGFNAGSAVASNALAAVAMLNTQVATAAAALAWMFAEWIVARKPSLLGIVSGAVAGLVAITPAAGFVNPTGSLLIGLIAGIGCYIAAVPVKKLLGYDDSLDVFGVHGVGGIIGAILTGVFADASVNPAGKAASAALQVYGVAVTIVYTAVVSALILFIIKAVIGLRVSTADEEAQGLDISLHGESVT